MHPHECRCFFPWFDVMRLVINRGNLDAVERLVAHHFRVNQVILGDLGIHRVCQRLELFRLETVDVQIVGRARTIDIKRHQLLAFRDVHRRDFCVRHFGKLDRVVGCMLVHFDLRPGIVVHTQNPVFPVP